jgi:hypothetical protein
VELKDPRPALTGNGEIEEKRKPLAHTTSGLENGPAGKNWGGKRNGWIAAHCQDRQLSLER